jgi:hypothetical protein
MLCSSIQSVFQQPGTALRQAEHLNFSLNQYDTTLVTAFNNKHPFSSRWNEVYLHIFFPYPWAIESAIEVEGNMTGTWLSCGNFGELVNMRSFCDSKCIECESIVRAINYSPINKALSAQEEGVGYFQKCLRIGLAALAEVTCLDRRVINEPAAS